MESSPSLRYGEGQIWILRQTQMIVRVCQVAVFLDNAPMNFWSATQKFMTLSVIDAKNMLYVYWHLQSLELAVDLPMLIEMDN